MRRIPFSANEFYQAIDYDVTTGQKTKKAERCTKATTVVSDRVPDPWVCATRTVPLSSELDLFNHMTSLRVVTSHSFSPCVVDPFGFDTTLSRHATRCHIRSGAVAACPAGDSTILFRECNNESARGIPLNVVFPPPPRSPTSIPIHTLSSATFGYLQFNHVILVRRQYPSSSVCELSASQRHHGARNSRM